MIDYTITEDIAILTIKGEEDVPNTLGSEVLSALEEATEKALGEAQGMVITGQGPAFLAGADLKMLMDAGDAEGVLTLARRLNTLTRTWEKWNKPVVAALNGSALGGGYELALGANHRIVVDAPKARFGLPEVTLGLMPGGGGTQRLPRMIGLKDSLPLLLQGRTLRPAEAVKKKLVDSLATDKERLLEQAIQWAKENATVTVPWDQRGFLIPGGGTHSAIGHQLIPGSFAAIEAKAPGKKGMAAREILSAVQEGLDIAIDSGLEAEARRFARLATSPEGRFMVKSIFFGVRECQKAPWRPKAVPPRETQKLGVLGAGMMGKAIAHVAARSGIPVVLKDLKQEWAENGKAHAAALTEKDVSRGRLSPEAGKEILDRITASSDPEAVKDCDLVIEAVIEDRKLKKQVTEESESVMAPEAIYASNTSTLPITSLAKESKRPEQFIGIHFFSPVEKMPLVEIILGEKTGDDAIAKALDLVKQMKKVPIVVRDGRGFYTSRCFTTFVAEGIELLNEGVAPALIERAAVWAGMPVGPLAVADEVSIELMHHILNQAKLDGEKTVGTPATLKIATKFVKDWNRPGRKAGAGFYDYPEGEEKRFWPELAKHFPLAKKQPKLEEVGARILAIQSLEAHRCLLEGILLDGRDGDVGGILGWGFPAYTGGPISYMFYRGPTRFLKECKDWAKKLGPRFEPPAELIAKG